MAYFWRTLIVCKCYSGYRYIYIDSLNSSWKSPSRTSCLGESFHPSLTFEIQSSIIGKHVSSSMCIGLYECTGVKWFRHLSWLDLFLLINQNLLFGRSLKEILKILTGIYMYFQLICNSKLKVKLSTLCIVAYSIACDVNFGKCHLYSILNYILYSMLF